MKHATLRKLCSPQGRSKLERNELIREYARGHPEKSLADIAEIFGVSRQRISIIIGSRPRVKKEWKL